MLEDNADMMMEDVASLKEIGTNSSLLDAKNDWHTDDVALGLEDGNKDQDMSGDAPRREEGETMEEEMFSPGMRSLG